MRVVIQRVSRASVSVNQQIKSSIGQGVLVLLGIEDADKEEDIDWLVKKISQLRIFDDQDGVMNQSLLEVAGDALVVSQFTLHASTKKGNRPSYIRASRPDVAIPLYNQFVEALSAILQKEVQTGEFGANMQVELLNDGPVTIIIDSKNKTF
ncbi:D-aminoacyl-tRNA deacylase [Sunxiuqinia dokdonensis]|uniref:D-aminoacyl-tRNA deacylase n=1 Tax=Sunxiuqinia dokdonensis TaxID=1409788 RepID=A0A0L8VEJ5_9BACT|nr:D-aminoacyl-tRNA deacylase [Sunxiuqinia dokdonensis]KOH46879.1 D-tyrosyl-tRNA(Tyr) deacylase [Sunxiuqinia dokdonensis]